MSSKRGKIAVGTALAAGAGYLIGLLTAPKSGRETRKDIKNTATKAKTEAERKLKIAHSELNNLLDETAVIAKNSKTKVDDGLAKARDAAEIVRQKSRELLSAVHEGEAEDQDLKNAVEEIKKATKHLKKFVTNKS